jgi:predicted RNA-binding Zn ribbon-like protein
MRYHSAISSHDRRRPFDFSANHVVLDFINTVSGRPTYSRDDLASADDVLEWAAASGMLHRDQSEEPDSGGPQQFAAAVALRENLYGVFGPVAGGNQPEDAALAFVLRRAARALQSSRWARGESGYEPGWPQDSIEAICDRLADEAVQLLRSPLTSRIGSCSGCGWLFLDTSRAHARRWCSMNACGVRDKMRRYHQRQANTHGSASQ